MAALALLALACWAGAANQTGAGAGVVVPAVYPAMTAGWTKTLALPNVLSQTPGLDPLKADALAPIAHELSTSLNYTPEAFAKLGEQERATAAHMAFEEAKHHLTQKIYELVGQSKNLVWSKETVGKDQLDALYPLAMKLREIDRNYGAFMDDTEREIVAASAFQTAASWRDARAAYVAKFGEAAKKALEAGTKKAESTPASTGVPAQTALRVSPSRTAENLLERMRATKAGWGQSDFETLFLGFGFAYREGSDHRRYYHPQMPSLIATVGRHGELKPHYARSAVKVIDELMALAAPASAVTGGVAAVDDSIPPPLDASYFPRKERKTPPKGIPAVVASLGEHSEKKAVAALERKEVKEEPVLAEVDHPTPDPKVTSDPTRLQPATVIAKAEPTETEKALENAAFTPTDEQPVKAPWWKPALDWFRRGK
jgi:hypothetical protein